MSNIIKQSGNTTSGTIVTAPGVVISSNTDRNGWSIQNVGTGVVFVNLGHTASSSAYHFALKPGTANDDGTGGIITQFGGSVFTGDISIAGTSPRVSVLEI